MESPHQTLVLHTTITPKHHEMRRNSQTFSPSSSSNMSSMEGSYDQSEDVSGTTTATSIRSPELQKDTLSKRRGSIIRKMAMIKCEYCTNLAETPAFIDHEQKLHYRCAEHNKNVESLIPEDQLAYATQHIKCELCLNSAQLPEIMDNVGNIHHFCKKHIYELTKVVNETPPGNKTTCFTFNITTTTTTTSLPQPPQQQQQEQEPSIKLETQQRSQSAPI